MVLVLLLVTGCATTVPFNVYIADKDPFKPDQTKYFSGTIKLKDYGLLNTGFAFFEIHTINNSSSSLWYLRTCYCASDWLFVDTIKFVVDGDIVSFESQRNPKREVGFSGTTNIFEENVFVVDEQFIRRFSSAQSATVRLAGKHYYVEKTLTAKDIYNIGWYGDSVVSLLSGSP